MLIIVRTECLLEGSIDGVGGDITRATLVSRVTNLERADNVEDGVSSARSDDSRGEVERVTVTGVRGEQRTTLGTRQTYV